jgi:hypothetical protein
VKRPKTLELPGSLKSFGSVALSLVMLLSLVLAFSFPGQVQAYDPPYFPLPPTVPHTNALGQKGVIDVTLYGAYNDNTHAIATTAAIQDAVNDGYAYNMPVYFPPGDYLVDDTIQMIIPYDQTGTPSSDRWGNALIGATTGTSRPVIHLKDGSSGFDGTTAGNGSNGIFNTQEGPGLPAGQVYHFKPVFYFWAQKSTDPTEPQPNVNFDNSIRGIDFDLGNNAGAVAIYHQGCEGSFIEDVKVTATNAFAGIFSLIGSGGSTTDLEVDGGKFGIYGEASQPAPQITGLKLENQTVNAIFYSGKSPLTIVGFKITNGPKPVIRVNVTTDNDPPVSNHASSGNLSLVDGSIKLSAWDANAAIIQNTDRSVFLKNVYVMNAGYFIKNSDISGADQSITSTDGSGKWVRIDEYAISKDYTPDTIFVGGTGYISGTTYPTSGPYYVANQTLPTDLRERHLWADSEKFAAFDQTGVINVEDYGAKGDGTTDNTTAIQNAIDSSASAKIFFPKGTYLISDKLVLKQNTQLFGVSQVSTRIKVDPNATDPSVETPMIQSYDGTDGANVLSNLKLILPASLNFYAIDWKSGGNSIVRDVWIRPVSPQDSSVALTWVKISGNGGGKWYNLLRIGTEGPVNANFREATINNTSQPLLFYMYHAQYGKTMHNPQDEITDSSNFSLFSAKFERVSNNDANAFSAAIQINNCDNFNIIGNSGVLEPLMGGSLPDQAILYLNSLHGTSGNNTNFTIANMGKNNGGNNDGWNYIESWRDGVMHNIEGDNIATLFKRGTSTVVTP